jgi:hypothetical protein
MNPPLKLKDAITSRMKILAKLDISEKRLPQDGRIKLKMKLNDKNKELDFRVSVLPTLFGEKIVMRLLDKDNLKLDMTKLGFEPESLVRFEEAIFKPWGMVLVTGPTGSGKTNTLYSALPKVAGVNIMTAEDPVEFNLPGHQPGADEGRSDPASRPRSALSSPGSEHHPRSARSATSRPPRSRSSGAHGHHRALHVAHQRRRHDQPPHEHGHRAIPGSGVRAASSPRSGWPAASAGTARSCRDDRRR